MTVLEESKAYKPFAYPWAVELTKKHEEIHWVEDEAELSEDVQDWRTKLSDQEKDFIENILRLFTQSDVDVGAGYIDKYMPIFKKPEARMMMSSFANMESIHQHAYSLLLDTVGMPDNEYKAFADYEEMADKHDYVGNFKPSKAKRETIAKTLAVYSALKV